MFLKTNVLQSFREFFEKKFDSIINELPAVLLALVMISIGIIVSKPISKWIARLVVGKQNDQLVRGFVETASRLIISVIFVIWGLQFAGYGNLANTILTSAGITTLIIGLAFQDLAQNFIGGIVLIFNRPFEKNDIIKIGDITGKVQSIKLRYTVVRTDDGRDVFIPNGDLIKNPLFNNSKDGYIRQDFTVTIKKPANYQEVDNVVKESISQVEDIINDAKHFTYTAVDKITNEFYSVHIYFWTHINKTNDNLSKFKSRVMLKVTEDLTSGGYSVNDIVS